MIIRPYPIRPYGEGPVGAKNSRPYGRIITHPLRSSVRRGVTDGTRGCPRSAAARRGGGTRHSRPSTGANGSTDVSSLDGRGRCLGRRSGVYASHGSRSDPGCRTASRGPKPDRAEAAGSVDLLGAGAAVPPARPVDYLRHNLPGVSGGLRNARANPRRPRHQMRGQSETPDQPRRTVSTWPVCAPGAV